MKCRCMDHDCISINEEVSVIERYESILDNSVPNVRSIESVDIEGTLKRIESRLTKIDSHSNGRYFDSATSRPSTRLCFGCNSPNHLWASCPQNANPRPRRNVRNATGDNLQITQQLRPQSHIQHTRINNTQRSEN
ncbi:hypothetical protein DPMN_076474 [Dreissena polymorpha]|uniref:CCHC-type domain-containing protein n=1 Tax=Dreissena polymorpha TaxID=45954 RepID=A0A9D3YLK2_DREPO|nr:hypothetical protein DPMN_076474 [Dreissena polymorpha]